MIYKVIGINKSKSRFEQYFTSRLMASKVLLNLDSEWTATILKTDYKTLDEIGNDYENKFKRGL